MNMPMIVPHVEYSLAPFCPLEDDLSRSERSFCSEGKLENISANLWKRSIVQMCID